MTMKIINTFIKFFTIKSKQDLPILGRWNIESCDKRINNKIDLSNIDHCGVCFLIDSNSKYMKKSEKKKHI